MELLVSDELEAKVVSASTIMAAGLSPKRCVRVPAFIMKGLVTPRGRAERVGDLSNGQKLFR